MSLSSLASGVTLGFAIGVGGVAAALLGALADHAGLTTVMWTIALLPIAGIAIALTLPETKAPDAQYDRLRDATDNERRQPEPDLHVV